MFETIETYELIKEFIKPELIILIPVMYLIGIAIKKSSVPNNTIPLFLGSISVLLSLMFIISTTMVLNWQELFLALFAGITQGVLCAGASVYVNQLIKQYKKDE